MPSLHRWTGIVCVIAFVLRPQVSFTSVLTAPPSTVAPITQEELKNGAYLEFRESWITRKRHNQLMWLPRNSTAEQAEQGQNGQSSELGIGPLASILVVGDSYADDVDMGFHCWPTHVSRSLRLPLLNVARGGSESSHVHAQLERAHSYSQQLNFKPQEALLILHTGGNNALHSLLKPWLFALLLSDLYSLRNSDVSPDKQETLELAFATRVSQSILKELDLMLGTAASLGHRNVLISTVPIVPSLPLARLLVHLLVPGSNATFVTQTLRSIGGSINKQLQTKSIKLTEKHGLHGWIFEEGKSLDRLAQQSDASSLGPLAAVKLALSRVYRTFLDLTGSRDASRPFHHFWHDGHHPAAAAHQQLGAEVIDLLKTAERKSAAILLQNSSLLMFVPLFQGSSLAKLEVDRHIFCAHLYPVSTGKTHVVRLLDCSTTSKAVDFAIRSWSFPELPLSQSVQVRFVSTVARRLRILGAWTSKVCRGFEPNAQNI